MTGNGGGLSAYSVQYKATGFPAAARGVPQIPAEGTGAVPAGQPWEAACPAFTREGQDGAAAQCVSGGAARTVKEKN